MKKLRKLTVLLLVCALMLALAGCGFTARMALAAKKMEKLQSYRTDMDVDMALKLSVLGQSMDMDMTIAGTTDVNTRPARSRSEMRIGMFGKDLTLLGYTDKTDAGRTTYSSSDGGRTWTKATAEDDDPAGRSDISALLKIASSFEKTGAETVRGEQATVYSGVITGADLENVSALSGLLRRAFSAMDMTMEDLDPAAYGDIPTTIAIGDKSRMAVRYTMDLTGFMENMMPAMMDAAMAKVAEESGLEGLDLSVLGFSLETGRVFATVELYDFDAVGAIEIPAAALEAPEAAA